MSQTVKILLVSNHPVVLVGLSHDLRDEPDIRIIGEARERLEAVQKAAALNPDIIIMDITTPEIDWEGAIASIKICLPATRVLVCSVGEKRLKQFEAERDGAWDCLPSNFTASQLLEKVRSLPTG